MVRLALAAAMTDLARASRGIRRLALLVCGGLWSAALVVTHLPRSSLRTIPANDKVLHGVGYFVLACALAVTLLLHGHAFRRRAVAVSIAAAAYGAFDELTQPLFGRSASWVDWLADMVGAAVAVIVFEAVLSMRARRKPSAAPGPKES